MLFGKRFKLEIATLAANDVNGKLVLITIPAGDIIKVVAGAREGDKLVDVLWKGRTLVMFAVDLKRRAIELNESSAAANGQPMP